MKIRIIILLLASVVSGLQANAFCGFYVARADAKLFNNRSEVILARHGNKTVVTMSNDFQGEVKDFAMVVPVPVVLQEEDIKVVTNRIFEKLNEYSAPRLVEYYDENPCQPIIEMKELSDIAMSLSFTEDFAPAMSGRMYNEYQVKIEAEYEVGEYDVLILSAKESTGLRRWLIDNDYKIPRDADEVLEPYIKSKMNFFVVKVNLDRMPLNSSDFLSPIQISYESDRFMLPIRLGMANANGPQDLIIYALTDQGRVECTNYRTVKMPTDRNIPLFVQEKFGDFYKSVYEKKWRQEHENAILLEYAWDVSPQQPVKCDPCVGPPPINNDLAEAGVDWLGNNGFGGRAYFTRLHVRYERKNFPQDLFFQVTPNTDRFQCRYVLTHPARGDMSCPSGQIYLQDLEMRRKKELDELAALTSWDVKYGNSYVKEFANQKKENKQIIIPGANDGSGGSDFPWTLPLTFLTMVVVTTAYQYIRRKAIA